MTPQQIEALKVAFDALSGHVEELAAQVRRDVALYDEEELAEIRAELDQGQGALQVLLPLIVAP